MSWPTDMSSIHSPPGGVSLRKYMGLVPLPQRIISCSSLQPDNYPEINLSCAVLNSASVPGASVSRYSDSWRNVLVPVNEGVLKRIFRTYIERGFTEALNEARDTQLAGSNAIIAWICEFSFRSMDFLTRLKSKVFPKTKEVGFASIAQYSEIRDWIRSSIRYLAWHPHEFKIAVAGVDDIVRIYTDEPAIMPVLKSPNQKWITCMAWRPFAAAELAVGCQMGICLWITDSTINITRSTSDTILLQHPNECPVTSLQWNSRGSILASASLGDTDILLWNVDNWTHFALSRVRLTNSLIKMSPDAANIFASTTTNVFRLWDKTMLPETWNIKEGNFVQSACWSPCSNFLLFVNSEEPVLHCLQYDEVPLFTNSVAERQSFKIADLSKTWVNNQEVGGRPQCVAWDPYGSFLAITFKDSSLIAIYKTYIQKFNLTIEPLYFLSGFGNEFPSHICFQTANYKNSDSVLTIGWSGGRIEYSRLVFLDSIQCNNMFDTHLF